MAQKFYNESDIQAIASAIRAKNGLSSTYTVSQMASAIQNIPSGSGGGNTDMEDGLVTGTLSIYENSRATSIRSYAFAYCSALTSVSFPQVTNINNNAFYSCSALTSVSFPQVTIINYSAFAYCSALTSVSFPQVTNINNNAFRSCDALTSVSAPQVTRIGSSVFAYCKALTSVSFPQVTVIDASAFSNCKALTSVSFPQATVISSQAFYHCNHLLFVSFPQVTVINTGAFSNCNALTSIILGGEQSNQGVMSGLCFYYCINLIDLTLRGSYFYSLSNSNAFTSTPIAGYSVSAGQYGSIYVPASLYSQYISATNWAYFSSRIVSF